MLKSLAEEMEKAIYLHRIIEPHSIFLKIYLFLFLPSSTSVALNNNPASISKSRGAYLK